MSWEVGYLIGVILVAIILFISEKISFDITAIFICIALMASGIVSIEQGLSGFSNQAAVTILALLILNNGLEHTGVIQLLTDKLINLTGNSVFGILVLILPFAALLSAFTNNTAVITMLLPIMMSLGIKKKISASKLLLPLAFVSILGGLCTIIGTSTNLLVNSVAVQYGLRPFSFFEFSYIGVILVVIGIVYSLLFGFRLIPERIRASKPEDEFEIKEYLAEMKISKNSSLIGKYTEVRESLEKKGLDLIRIKVAPGRELIPKSYHILNSGNILLLKGTLESIIKVQEDKDFEKIVEHKIVKKEKDQISTEDGTRLIEALISPQSSLVDRKLGSVNFSIRYDSIPIAVNRLGKRRVENIGDFTLKVGDTLLLEASKTINDNIFAQNDLIFLSSMPKAGNIKKQITSLGIMILAILLAALGIVPIVLSALAGIVAMVVSNCIDPSQMYKQIEWRVYFLIAGLIPLGIAIQNTGLDKWIASSFVSSVDSLNIFSIILILFFVTCIVTNFMANNATALIMAPIAVSIAQQLNIDPHALLLTVMFAASTSFFTPIGYHTLTLIYVPGKYKFRDYVVSGAPLTILVAFVASWLIWKTYI